MYAGQTLCQTKHITIVIIVGGGGTTFIQFYYYAQTEKIYVLLFLRKNHFTILDLIIKLKKEHIFHKIYFTG